jgi:hypothetical protein
LRPCDPETVGFLPPAILVGVVVPRVIERDHRGDEPRGAARRPASAFWRIAKAASRWARSWLSSTGGGRTSETMRRLWFLVKRECEMANTSAAQRRAHTRIGAGRRSCRSPSTSRGRHARSEGRRSLRTTSACRRSGRRARAGSARCRPSQARKHT